MACVCSGFGQKDPQVGLGLFAGKKNSPLVTVLRCEQQEKTLDYGDMTPFNHNQISNHLKKSAG
ncbi:MAG: hypothetical protein Q9205_002296 [Flavoplaca limonia]